MRLKDWAAQKGIHYQTAWKWFRDGKLPVPAVQTPSGTILVQPDTDTRPPEDGGLGLYARVSSHDQPAHLDRQVARLTQWAAAASAARVVRVEAEVASGMTGRRPKLRRVRGHPAGRAGGGGHRGPGG